MHTEPIVSWNKRISPGLSVRSSWDEVSITTRSTGWRVLFATLFAGAVVLVWYLWRIDAFYNLYPSNVVILHALIFVPIVLLGAFYAFPGQRLVASKSLGYLEVQHRWLCLPVLRRRVEIGQCHRVSVATLRKEEEVEEGFSAAEQALRVALEAVVLGASLGLLSIARKTRKAMWPVYALEVVRRDGSSILSHFTWNVEDCVRAVKLVWDNLPELEPKPLVDAVGEGLEAGERVNISLDHGWARGATGVVAKPPEAVARYGPPWEGVRRYEGSGPARRIFYWIRFDEPQTEPGTGGRVEAGEIASLHLARK